VLERQSKLHGVSLDEHIIPGALRLCRQLLDDPIFLVMVFATTAVLRDQFGIVFYLGVAALALVVYPSPVKHDYNRECTRTAFVIILAITSTWSVVGYPLLPLVPAQWNDLWTIQVDGATLELLPGWLFLLFYVLPVVGRRIVDGHFRSLAKDFRIDRRDWIFLGVIALRSFYASGLPEELFYRGFLLYLLLHVCHRWQAIAVSTGLFLLAHYTLVIRLFSSPSAFVIGNLIAVAALGLLLGWLYVRTRKLMVCVLIHGMVNGLIDLCHVILPDVKFPFQGY
jgi:membrane protease YdiL (CAAX protease family)